MMSADLQSLRSGKQRESGEALGEDCSFETWESDEGRRGIVWAKTAAGTGSAQHHAAGDLILHKDWNQNLAGAGMGSF